MQKLDLILELDRALVVAELAPRLRELFFGDEPQPELRLDLPREWAIFWKRRDSESRLLVSHPEHDQWVVTAALEPEMGRKLVERLEHAQAGETLKIQELGRLGSVSNLDWIIRLG